MLLLVVIMTFLTVVFGTLAAHSLLKKNEIRAHMRVTQALQAGRPRNPGELPAEERMARGGDPPLPVLRQLFGRLAKVFEAGSITEAVQKEIQAAGVAMRGGEFIALSLVTAVVGSFVGYIVGGTLFTLAFFAAGLLIPRAWLRMRAARRLKAFEGQLLDALTMMSGSLKAGYSFMQAMEMVAREMPPPMSDEFRRSLREMSFGMATEDSLSDMADRVRSPDFDLVVTAVLIQRQVGGNLAEVLDKIAFTVRERIRIKGEIKTLTAQGRISGFIVALLPLGIGAFITMINPGYMMPLFTNLFGQVLIGAGVVSQIIGIVVIRKIVNIEV